VLAAGGGGRSRAGSDDTVATVSQWVQEGKVDFVLHSGDVSYADGDASHWDVFLRKIQPIASQVPYLTQVRQIVGRCRHPWPCALSRRT
jgi:hypothetical protein